MHKFVPCFRRQIVTSLTKNKHPVKTVSPFHKDVHTHATEQKDQHVTCTLFIAKKVGTYLRVFKDDLSSHTTISCAARSLIAYRISTLSKRLVLARRHVTQAALTTLQVPHTWEQLPIGTHSPPNLQRQPTVQKSNTIS